jgi:hypothetical protein
MMRNDLNWVVFLFWTIFRGLWTILDKFWTFFSELWTFLRGFWTFSKRVWTFIQYMETIPVKKPVLRQRELVYYLIFVKKL